MGYLEFLFAPLWVEFFSAARVNTLGFFLPYILLPPFLNICLFRILNGLPYMNVYRHILKRRFTHFAPYVHIRTLFLFIFHPFKYNGLNSVYVIEIVKT